MDMKDFGTLLRTLRKQKSMTQEALADRLCVSTSAISKWENGKNLLDIALMQKLAQIFEISLDDLCNCEETLTAINHPQPQAYPKNACDTTQSVRYFPLSTHSLFSVKGVVIPALVFVCVFSFCLGIHHSTSRNIMSSYNIRPIVSHITQDDTCGTVYEMAHLFQGDIDTLDSDTPYIKELSQQWLQDTSVNSQISVMKLSFYESPEDITHWTLPQKIIYLSR